ncbi:DUF4259 domain-containing protein [Myxococcota bacterium]|nr:DUF4259 domain-containing protein [Myxococcota bacterium]
MSSWGPKPFDNDSALDWFAEVTTRGAAEVCRVLEIVADADPDEYVDVDDASVAIAAATIVAACSGSPDARLPHAHLKQALLTVLGARGLEATEAQRARIWASQDLAEIQRWLAHVVETSSVTALLDE